jgi:mannosyltransferase OCH1-like enzyme
LYRGWLDRWTELHPEWEHRLWSEDTMPALKNQDLYDRATEITHHSPWQYRADVIRYELLWEHGGVYLDMDFEPVRAIDPLMNGQPWSVVHARRFIGNAAMAFPPRHPAMGEAIERLAETAALPPNVPSTIRSGPQFFTPIARRHKVKAWPEHYFFPYDSTQLSRGKRARGAYATHHWNNKRTKRNRPL